MKDPAPAGKCCRCHHLDATHANECKRCHAVTLCMVTIHSIWDFNELEKLADDLGKVSTKEWIAESRETGAFYRRKLGNIIKALATPAGTHPDDLKRRVVIALREYLGEINGIRAYEAKPGNEGMWMKHFSKAFSDCFNKIATTRG